MMDIVKMLQEQSDLYTLRGASDEAIKAAESELGLQFASDYRQYVAAFGAVSFKGHELTGVCNSKRLSVVAVTKDERINTDVPSDWYVLEQANIDGIVLWQTSNGAVYQTAPDVEFRKICSSLTEYIALQYT